MLLCSSLFNLQGTRSNRGTVDRLPHLFAFVNTFFRAARTFFTLDGGRKPACEEAFALANMPYLNTFLPPLQALFLLFPLFCRNRLITPPYIGYYCQKWQNRHMRRLMRRFYIHSLAAAGRTKHLAQQRKQSSTVHQNLPPYSVVWPRSRMCLS